MDAAAKFLDALERDYLKLLRMPGMGAKREFENPRFVDLRSWPVSGFRNYLIFYRRISSGIEIVRVLHGARDIESIFEDA
jgi:toxin ParE1/3/4